MPDNDKGPLLTHTGLLLVQYLHSSPTGLIHRQSIAQPLVLRYLALQVVDRSEETGLPYVFTAVLHEGPLPQLLRTLLVDCTLQEVGGRDMLYRAVYRLLQCMGACAFSCTHTHARTHTSHTLEYA